MCWISVSFSEESFGDPNGHVTLFTPENDLEELEIPERAFPVNERVSLAVVRYGDKTRGFLAGGLSDTCMVTEQRDLLRCFISPINRQLVTSATPASHQVGLEKIPGSTGLVGSCIFYLRWRDPLRNRRSPLSGPSETLVLSGTEAVRFHNLPLRPSPEDYGVTEIEVWCNRNGITNSAGRLVYRLVGTRDANVDTITITEESEGEAETEEGLQQVPRGRYNVIYHNRRFWSGDEREPARIYASPLDRYDEYGGFFRRTLNGETVTGMAVVRDTLIIFCAKATYKITGYSEFDIVVEILEPKIGCVTHFSIQMVGQIALFLSARGFAICTGNAVAILMMDCRALITQLYAQIDLRPSFENGWAINDERSGVYRFIQVGASIGTVSDGAIAQWILDYQTPGDMESGNMPLLSFDEHAYKPSAAAMLALPDGRTEDCYALYQDTTHGFLSMVRENNWKNKDVSATFGNEESIVVIQTPMFVAEVGGGPYDGMTLHDFWLFITNINSQPETFTIRIQNGNELSAWTGVYGGRDTIGQVLDHPSGSNGGKTAFPPITFAQRTGQFFFPQAILFAGQNLAGEGFSIEINTYSPEKLVYKGFGMTVGPGSKPPFLMPGTE